MWPIMIIYYHFIISRINHIEYNAAIISRLNQIEYNTTITSRLNRNNKKNPGGPVHRIRANAFSKSLDLWTTVGSVSVKIDPM